MGVVIAILLVAIVLGVLGVIVKGLLWLLFVAILVAVGAFVYGWVKNKARGGRTRV